MSLTERVLNDSWVKFFSDNPVLSVFIFSYLADTFTTMVSLFIWNDGNIVELNPFMKVVTENITGFFFIRLIGVIAFLLFYMFMQKRPYAQRIIQGVLILLIIGYSVVITNNAILLHQQYNNTVITGYSENFYHSFSEIPGI